MHSFSIALAAEQMAVLVAFLIIGVAAERRNDTTSTPSTILDRAILDWLLPITIVYNISHITWGLHSVTVVSLCILITALDAALVLMACILFHVYDKLRRTLLLVVPLGNTAYFGYAAVTALLGSKFLPDAIVFDQVGTTLMLALYGNAIAKESGTRVSSNDLLELLRFRPLWAFAIGIILDAVRVNLAASPVRILGEAISASLLPVAMLALGSKLYLKGLIFSRAVAIGVIIRGIIGPIIIFGFWSIFTNSRTAFGGALIQTAMPSMIAAALLAERRGLVGNVAYSLCSVGVVLACIVLPFFAFFLVR